MLFYETVYLYENQSKNNYRMKKIVLLVTGMFLGLSLVNAQDTLIYENFNDTFPTPMMVDYPLAIVGDTSWYNWDADGLGDGSGGGRPNEWYWVAYGSSDSLTQGFAFAANSWTNDFTTPVANWLISKSIQITDGPSAVLKWKSAPFQTPAYLDGYVVLLSTTNNELTSFTDTLFVASEYDDLGGGYVTYCGDFAPYTFTPSSGFTHGLDGTFIEVNADYDGNPADTTCSDSSRFNGLMREHTVALTAYDDMQIYIAWVHNSTDDNILMIDDILLTETTDITFGIEGENELAGQIYPNPATDFFNVKFDIMQYHNPVLQMFNTSGQVVYTSMLTEEYSRVYLNDIAPGAYVVKITADEGTMIKKVIVTK